MCLAVRVVGRVSGHVRELAVGRRVCGAMRAGVPQPGVGRFSQEDVLRGHGKEAEVATAGLDVRIGGLDDLTVAHRRHVAPRQVHGEEVPVAEHVAGRGVGHVVGGDRERVDLHPDLARLEGARWVVDHLCGADV